ncbi:MAG: hypothetical protein LBH74_02475 [Nitrososphaerota archaeon]|nr:hypothetical protein [Nitrososphaerota archaeon]
MSEGREHYGSFANDVKLDILTLKGRVTQLEAEIQSAGRHSISVDGTKITQSDTANGVRNMGIPSQYVRSDNTVDFNAYQRDLRETMYQTRMATVSMRGYLRLAKETGMLPDEQAKTLTQINHIISMAWQAQKTLEAVDRMSKITMASNPFLWGMLALSIGGRVAGTLATANRMHGSSGV